MSFRVCRHIKTDGVQCQSPAMREDKFCYFHTTLRRRHEPLANQPDTSTLRPVFDKDGKFSGMEALGPPSGGIELGLLEDTASVQVAISTVVNALANNRLEVRRATALLYGLQLAASNCRHLARALPPELEEILRQTLEDAYGQPTAQSGSNSSQTWDYPDDPEEHYESEEELRLAEQDGEDEEDEPREHDEEAEAGDMRDDDTGSDIDGNGLPMGFSLQGSTPFCDLSTRSEAEGSAVRPAPGTHFDQAGKQVHSRGSRRTMHPPAGQAQQQTPPAWRRHDKVRWGTKGCRIRNLA